MDNVIPFRPRVTTSDRIKQVMERDRELQAASQKQRTFSKGDSFTTADGVFVSVQGERITELGRELLYCAHGVRTWASESLFIPVYPEDGVA